MTQFHGTGGKLTLNGKEYGAMIGEWTIDTSSASGQDEPITLPDFTEFSASFPLVTYFFAMPYQLIVSFRGIKPFRVDGMINPDTLRGYFYFDLFDSYALVDIVADDKGNPKDVQYRATSHTLKEARRWIMGNG